MNSSGNVSLSEPERQRSQRVAQLANQGPDSVGLLIEALSDESWAVRRGVVNALAKLGDAGVTPLCKVLVERRGNEAVNAAAVDALVLSAGDVEAALFPLADHVNPAVVYDVAQILGQRRSGPGVAVLERLIAHADDNVAVAALEGLGRIGGVRAVQALVRAATSGNFFRTFPAIDVLGCCQDPAAVQPLLKLLEQPLYAAECVRALGRTGDERAIRPLVDLLTRPADALVRAIARALVEIEASQQLHFGQTHVVSDVLHAVALPTSLGRRVAECVRGAELVERTALCRLLGWVGGEAAITQLVELLSEGPEVAKAASEALGELGQTAEAQLLATLHDGDSRRRLAVLPHVGRGPAAAGQIVQCLEDGDPAVRAAACDALRKMGEPSAVAALFLRLADGDPRVIQCALGALQSLGSPRTEGLTLEAAMSKDSRVRRSALRIIAYFGYPSGLPALLSAMADPDEKLRDAAIYGLPFIEDTRAREALLTAATHASPRTRAAAMRALGQCSSAEKLLLALREGLSDSDAWVRYYAVQSLGKLKDGASADRVIERLQDDAGHVRVAVVDALANLNTDRAASALMAAASSSDPDVQRAALLGLGVTQRPESLATLLAALKLPEPSTRLVAVSAVAEFPGADVIPALVEAARDSAPTVRNAAVGYLAARKGTAATEALIHLLPEPSLRELVLATLAHPVEGRIPGLRAAIDTAADELASLLVGALARMHRADAIAALMDVLRESGLSGRKAAAHALASLDSPASRVALGLAAREDADIEVRRICTLALVP